MASKDASLSMALAYRIASSTVARSRFSGACSLSAMRNAASIVDTDR